MNKLLGVALLSAILLNGCGESSSEAKVIKKEIDTEVAKVKEDVKKEVVAKKENIVKKVQETSKAKVASPQVSKFYTIFKDGAKIAPDGKPMLLVFGQTSDPYTQKLKDDIISNDDLAAKITEIVTPIYLDARATKMHKFMHNAELMDVDTKTLVSIYNVTSTPNLIFTDAEANHILVVPGYMPPKQFMATLDFIKEGVWKGKDTKNGEVYDELKKYYSAHGIEIKAKK